MRRGDSAELLALPRVHCGTTVDGMPAAVGAGIAHICVELARRGRVGLTAPLRPRPAPDKDFPRRLPVFGLCPCRYRAFIVLDMAYGHAERNLETARSLERQTALLLDEVKESDPALWRRLVALAEGDPPLAASEPSAA